MLVIYLEIRWLKFRLNGKNNAIKKLKKYFLYYNKLAEKIFFQEIHVKFLSAFKKVRIFPEFKMTRQTHLLKWTFYVLVMLGMIATIWKVFFVHKIRPKIEESPIILGSNLTSIRDWSTEWAFIDAFKSSRRWIPQCDPYLNPDCPSDLGWSTGEYDKIQLDEKGWVKCLPDPQDKEVLFRSVATIMFRDIGDHFPAGNYVVLYEGEGTIEYGFCATKIDAASKPGRDVIRVKPSDAGIYLRITSTDPNKTGNYIRNIRVIMPGGVCKKDASLYCEPDGTCPKCGNIDCLPFEQVYQTQIFHPVFLNKIKDYRLLRFMDWMDTNNSKQGLWKDRPKMDDARWSLEKGVPIELMITLANVLKIEPWFNMPHQATDNYIRKFAALVRDNLKPKLKVYLEYSNEVWNPQFVQGDWVQQQAEAQWPDSKKDGYTKRINWYGMRTAQICDMWKEVWQNRSSQIVCVMGTQGVRPWVSEQALDCPLWEEGAPCFQHGIDALAISAYFGHQLGAPEYEEEVMKWTKEPDGGLDTLFDEIFYGGQLPGGPKGGLLHWLFDMISQGILPAQSRRLDFFAYEGGQHVAGQGRVNTNESLTHLFTSANRDPRMGDAYKLLLDGWQKRGGKIFMHFSNCGKYTKWGSFGALEYIDQNRSPKYDTLRGYLQ